MTPALTASDPRSGRYILSPRLDARAAWVKAILSHHQTPDTAAPAQAWIGPAPLWADGQPYGIWCDAEGDPNAPATAAHFERALAQAPLDDATTLARARRAIEWWTLSEISKFSDGIRHDQPSNIPYVLVLDEPKGENTQALATEMLVFAQTETLNAQVLILGCAGGHFDTAPEDPRVTLLPESTPPWALFAQATAVYTLAAPLGFEAILSGHRPRIFGQPWYAGWGLTQDENPPLKRTRKLTRAQLVAATLLAPNMLWADPDTGAPWSFEHAMAAAEAAHRSAQERSDKAVLSNMAPWKHRFLRRYLSPASVSFARTPQTVTTATQNGAQHMTWGIPAPDLHDADLAGTDLPDPDLRIEDGFLRSKGLGAALVPPVSLVFDDLGIYFDPTRPSRLEQMIAARETLPSFAAARIDALLATLRAQGLSKYNTGSDIPQLDDTKEKILVVGQVEDDASIRLGAGDITTNAALLEAARAAHPQAQLIFKPHPDVEAGLRKGDLSALYQNADIVARDADPIALIEACDRLWTMTSLMGFEALIRDTPVTTTGTPFYAGWGLTTDLGNRPARRAARPSVAGLAYATLIDYPRYFDPQTGQSLSVEQAIELLGKQKSGRSKPAQIALSTLLKIRDLFRRR